jgi:outer membrane protein W
VPERSGRVAGVFVFFSWHLNRNDTSVAEGRDRGRYHSCKSEKRNGEALRNGMKYMSVLLLLSVILGTISKTVGGTDFGNHGHKWAISFAIEDNLRLEPYNGYGISATRIFSDKYSIRLSQSLSINDRDQGNRNSFEIRETTSLVFLGRFNPNKRAQCYWGAGFNGRYEYSEDKVNVGTEVYSHTRKEWTVGVLGIIGVEVFATDYIGFHAEYRS